VQQEHVHIVENGTQSGDRHGPSRILRITFSMALAEGGGGLHQEHAHNVEHAHRVVPGIGHQEYQSPNIRGRASRDEVYPLRMPFFWVGVRSPISWTCFWPLAHEAT